MAKEEKNDRIPGRLVYIARPDDQAYGMIIERATWEEGVRKSDSDLMIDLAKDEKIYGKKAIVPIVFLGRKPGKRSIPDPCGEDFSIEEPYYEYYTYAKFEGEIEIICHISNLEKTLAQMLGFYGRQANPYIYSVRADLSVLKNYISGQYNIMSNGLGEFFRSRYRFWERVLPRKILDKYNIKMIIN
jgi:hypothetical protein